MKPTVYAPCVEFVLQQPELRLEHRIDGQLWAVRANEEHAVSARRCFPWSEPVRFVSLRDKDDKEVALIRQAEHLDDASREVLEQALIEAAFVLHVVKIYEVEEEVEIRTWKVDTKQGARTFQTRLDDWPRELPGGGLLIRDVAGDLYHIADREALDDKSKKLLWAFAD